MNYIDSLLVNIVNHDAKALDTVSPREANVLRSLASSVSGHFFITENQSKLLLKILGETADSIPTYTDAIKAAIKAPNWSKPFRQIELVKRMFIDRQSAESELQLIIEFTFSAQIRKALTQAKDIENLVQAGNGKLYFAELTEQNIVSLVELLRPLDFDIDELILKHYDTIKSWVVEDVKNQFLITNMTNQNFQKHITADLGITTAIDENIIHDRSMRYRYRTDKVLESDGTLTNYLAGRTRSRVWVDRNKHSLSELVTSIIELKRAPIMFVFDYRDDKSALNMLKSIDETLAATGLDNNVGIYFRLPNNEHGTQFNELVAERKFNQYLGPDTEVVGVQSGKLPKFFLTTNWKPMSVIAIDSQFRSSKTAVYASCCDLVVTYTDTPPIVEKPEKWQ